MIRKKQTVNFKKRHGFTLIELLISIAILSMLLLTGTYSYSLMSSRWTKELGEFNLSSSQAKNLDLFHHVITGTKSFIVTDNAKKPAFFFIGKPDSLLAVSNSGLFSGHFPEIYRLTTVKNEMGLYDLVYQAESTENTLLTSTEQVISFSRKIKLFENLDAVSISYYGWPHYYEKTKSIDDAEGGAVSRAKWFDVFSGIDNQIMPEKLLITLTKANKELVIPVQLDHDSQRLLSPYFGMLE